MPSPRYLAISLLAISCAITLRECIPSPVWKGAFMVAATPIILFIFMRGFKEAK